VELTADIIGPGDLALALRAGVHRLLGAQEHLDRINVFPVPDGDTGTNLAATASAILPILSDAPDHVGRLLTSAADAALDGARGNSGAILAQWLLGVSDQAAAYTTLDRRGFADALAGGATYAREALSDPREGTILSVLTEVAAAVASQADALSFPGLCARAVGEARESLAATRHNLDVLEKAGVVDAGAAGFVAFLEGFNDFVQTGQVDALPDGSQLPVFEREVAGSETTLEHRWCTECMVSGAVDRKALRERLSALGSSLVVAGTGSKARVHIHAADPADVFRVVAEFGLVSAEKADDMQRQQESTAHANRRRVAVVTDSAGDLPDELLESLDIHVVPVRLAFGPNGFLDKVSLTPPEFYRMLVENPHHPKTSQPAPGDFRRLYGYLCSHHDAVVSIHVSGRVSGTWQSAESAASRLAESSRVRVIDSYSASAGQGLLAIHAAECADRGLDEAAVVASVESLRSKTQTYAYLPTLDYAVKGGRVPPIARSLARFLHVLPLLATRPDGRLGLGGALFGRRHPLEKFARFIARRLRHGQAYRVIVAHGDALASAEQFVAALQTQHGHGDDIHIVPSGAALGVHGGPGFLAVGFHPIE
jgi:DegV family protein with EDD domain